MAWEICEVSLGGKTKHSAQADGSIIFIPYVKGMKVGETISVNGKAQEVDSWALDPREEAITIKLAMASKEAKAEEKSDGKQVKGPS